MIQLKVRDIVLQPGRPKVAVPVISKQPAEIIAECEALRELPCDMVEWRADYYLSAIKDIDGYLCDMNGYLDIVKILDDINYIADDKPIIFTIRSEAQGGQVQLSKTQLENVCSIVAETGLADFIDIEFMDSDGSVCEEWLREMIDEAHKHDVKVILSHHDNMKMPSPAELVELVKQMYMLGTDVCKVAATSTGKADTEDLLKATAFLTKKKIGPIIMIAMGTAGLAARVAAGKYGSCITFAAGKEISAPGQIDAYTMKKWLDSYYEREV